jgi:hypothetical protein
MTDERRYRVEGGLHVIDVRLDSIETMFDNRDPAPFRKRDLDPDLVEYLLAAAEDVDDFRVMFHLGKPEQAHEVEPAFRAHMQYELDRIDRRIRHQRRAGQVVLLIGVAVLVATIGASQVVGEFPGSNAVKELLLLASWVVMWRPLDTLVYGWLPLTRQRKLLRRLCAANVSTS